MFLRLALVCGSREIAHPPDQPVVEAKSITWLESRQVAHEANEVLAFVVDKDFDDFGWPPQLREEDRLAEGRAHGKIAPELVAEVQRNAAKLQEFKKWLGARDPKFAEFFGATIHAPTSGPMCEQTAWINIRGLHARRGNALQPVPIGNLYIPLTTASPGVSRPRRRHRHNPRADSARKRVSRPLGRPL